MIKMIKKRKEPCEYWKLCMDYKRSKDICHDGEWKYCKVYLRLKKLDERRLFDDNGISKEKERS